MAPSIQVYDKKKKNKKIKLQLQRGAKSNEFRAVEGVNEQVPIKFLQMWLQT